MSALLASGSSVPLQARHCGYHLFASPMVAVGAMLWAWAGSPLHTLLCFPQGNQDFLFSATPGLSNPAIGVSFQSVNFPTYYLGILPVSVSANTIEGSLRLGLMLPGAALDNATWLILSGLAGGLNSYSFQVCFPFFNRLKRSCMQSRSPRNFTHPEHEPHCGCHWAIHDAALWNNVR